MPGQILQRYYIYVALVLSWHMLDGVVSSYRRSAKLLSVICHAMPQAPGHGAGAAPAHTMALVSSNEADACFRRLTMARPVKMPFARRYASSSTGMPPPTDSRDAAAITVLRLLAMNTMTGQPSLITPRRRHYAYFAASGAGADAPSSRCKSRRCTDLRHGSTAPIAP